MVFIVVTYVVLGLIALLAFLRGLRDGFIKAGWGLVNIVIITIFTIAFMGDLVALCESEFGLLTTTQGWVASMEASMSFITKITASFDLGKFIAEAIIEVVLALVIIIVMALVKRLVKKLIDFSVMRVIDKIIGGIYYIALTAIVIVLLAAGVMKLADVLNIAGLQNYFDQVSASPVTNFLVGRGNIIYSVISGIFTGSGESLALVSTQSYNITRLLPCISL